MKTLWAILGLVFLASSASVEAAGKTRANLLLAAETVRPGDTVTAGLHLQMPPRWHTYWRHPGDSGMPTTIDWELPEGVTAGEIRWPIPEKYPEADLITYVYHDDVVLLVPLKVGDNVPPGPLEIAARVSWLECEVLCLPGRANVEATLKIGPETVASPDAEFIEEWRQKLPQEGSGLKISSAWDAPASAEIRPLLIQWESESPGAAVDFFPYGGDDFEVAGATDSLPAQGNVVSLRKKVKKSGDDWPAQIAGILVVTRGEDQEAYEVNLSTAGAAQLAGAAAPSESGGSASLPLMLVLAFLGGVILNIMPCVLPVIALKVLGFVNLSKESAQRVRQLGWVFGAGVLVSFLILAGMVIAVQQAGKAATWGMQFQNTQFLVLITVLVTLVALNLFGVFEVMVGGRAIGAAGELAAKEGAPGAFFHGLLVTVLATPCSAPFLGAALGFAFTQPPAMIVLIFLMIGAGLAAPYVILSLKPAWVRFMPKPGPWMVKFKVAMGFPMLATAVWLFSLTVPHFGKGGALWFGLFLVILALGVWVWGQFVQAGLRHRGLAGAISLALVLGGYAVAMETQLHWRGGLVEAEAAGLKWEPWTPQSEAAFRASGRPVLVDFTADWCLTCQANKKTSIDIPSVRAKLREIDGVAMLGDYTREDPAITAELQKFQRAGVPMVVVYPKDPKATPILLPEVLTPGIVLEALEKAAM